MSTGRFEGIPNTPIRISFSSDLCCSVRSVSSPEDKAWEDCRRIPGVSLTSICKLYNASEESKVNVREEEVCMLPGEVHSSIVGQTLVRQP